MTEGTAGSPQPTKRPGRARTPEPPLKKGSDAKEETNGKSENCVEKKNGAGEEEQEFGGPIGAACVMVGSHIFLACMTMWLRGTDLTMFIPTAKTVTVLLGYHLCQYLCARFMPGVHVPGQAGIGYLCNAYTTFYATLAVVAAVHLSGTFDLTELIRDYPAYLATAVLIADVYSVIVHLCYARGAQIFSIYDFFMGIGVHPRIGIVDIKMVAETRVSWTLLFIYAIAGHIETTRQVGTWLNPSLFIVLAHWLYGNACAKGEHFIPYTWDMTTEKFGWMLCWWNLAGVPLLYCFQSLYIAQNAAAGLVLFGVPPAIYYSVITVLLLLAYWVWDEANYHKCYFKMEERNEIINRNLFPTFRHIKNAKTIKCEVTGGKLLIDGWYGVARKVHYAADASMALLWGLGCGFGSLMPYVYFCFFSAMITHRTLRDETRCAEKYGATWDKYLKAVPYRFFPGIF